ncbi:pyruvate ferredoxin oxidoreductase [Candidatus Bathyarchaeota archaeon]|nr:pyruvate ferredoxin oxidoreductase [Candidatus Bathyarchaeota archaeon]
MSKIIGLSGNEAAAYAAKQSKVDVVAAYPITPQTIIVERFSEYVANGEVETEFICVESEHSAMSACIGASLAGARVFTATCSQGLALMHEMLYIASGLRLPIVMDVANRALSAPINIHCDHSDMMGSRDCGWIQVFCENVQEVYDWTIQAFKLSEDLDVLLPTAVNFDGFTITHAMEDVNVLEDSDVEEFLSIRKTKYKLDPDEPMTFGALTLPDYYFEVKRQQEEAMKKAYEKYVNVVKQYEALSGRAYNYLHEFMLEDAEAAIICLGSTAGLVRQVAKKLRNKGRRVGVLKPWLFRPFPSKELLKALENVKSLAVLDRSLSFGAPFGPLCSDVITTLFSEEKTIPVFNVIYGLGGREITPKEVEDIFNLALKAAKTGKVEEKVKFVGVRE